ncbi:MAG: AtpZ/AtpI family protein [Proteobacteria bacterium]|nr:AtpZ/AtpI family protein [Pseudomonadota bacterium]MDA0960775.1 AtpZ/AtpI family protein [Pseudomonadota bacterium]MDA1151721.1 AtpZ/AtpI family protein [Pseudomonadota bacterium]
MNEKDSQRDNERLADIDRRLDKLQAQREEKDRPSRSAFPEGMAAIMGRVATELVAGVMVGAFIGWALDRWLETSPLFLLVMFFMGAIAGMLNVWRVFTGRGLAAGYFDEHKNSSGKDD